MKMLFVLLFLVSCASNQNKTLDEQNDYVINENASRIR